MRGLFTSQSFQLGAGELLSGCAQRAQILRIRSGSAWVTIEGVDHDYWLAAGDALRIASGGLVVVEAQGAGLQAHTTGEAVAAESPLMRTVRAALTVVGRWAARKIGAKPATGTPAACRA